MTINLMNTKIDGSFQTQLLLFLQSYIDDKCPERIIACKSASNARAQISPLAGFPIHSLSQKTEALSIGQTFAYICALKNNLLSWI